MKTHSENSELAGTLHQIKTRMTERGLVSAEELDEYKAKFYDLQKEFDKTRKDFTKRLSEEAPKSIMRKVSKTNLNIGEQKKDQGVQCFAEKQQISPDKTIQNLKNVKASKGMAGVFDNYSSGYLAPLVIKM